MSHWHARKRKRVYRPASGPRHFAPSQSSSSSSSSSHQPDLLDQARGEFARAAAKNHALTFDLGEWDRGFIRSMAFRYLGGQGYTPKMREHLDRLIASHGHRVEWSGRPDLKPVRSTTREAYVPDEAAALLSRGRGRAGGQGR